MAVSPYMLAQYAIYWVFPSTTERAACVPNANERYKLAYQQSDNTTWILDNIIGPVWKAVGGASAALGNVPFYTSIGTLTPIALVGNQVPFYFSNGTASNIILV